MDQLLDPEEKELDEELELYPKLPVEDDVEGFELDPKLLLLLPKVEPVEVLVEELELNP
ncbi:MAG: hypothetical protein GX130_09265 [Candidatus Hydrogenedens sp.]|nr:hypothetical protein [Candidatus Hydrogenedens sp.]